MSIVTWMSPKLGVEERIVERYASSKISKFVSAVRLGWNSYSFIFYIGGISVILGGIYSGWTAVAAVIITVVFFYYAGRFKEAVDRREKKKAIGKKEPRA
jgi:hypothetical protein